MNRLEQAIEAIAPYCTVATLALLLLWWAGVINL